MQDGPLNFSSFPAERYLGIEGDTNREGRIVVNRHHDGFSVEIDIVQKEGKKIWHHVGRHYGLRDAREALEDGVHTLSTFLQGGE